MIGLLELPERREVGLPLLPALPIGGLLCVYLPREEGGDLLLDDTGDLTGDRKEGLRMLCAEFAPGEPNSS